MYITIKGIIGEKAIDLSYPIHSGKEAYKASQEEVAVITMLRDNLQYDSETHIIRYVPSGNKKKISGGTFTGRELISMLEGVIEPTEIENDDRVTKMNKLRRITEMIFNLNELDNSDNLEDGRPSNTLLTYHVTGDDKNFTCFKTHAPEYKKLKNREFTSLTLRIMDQKNNIITDGPQVIVVLHIHDHKL